MHATCNVLGIWHEDLPDPLHAHPSILGLLESTLETLAFVGTLRVWRSAADSTAGLQRRPHLVHGCCSEYVQVHRVGRNIPQKGRKKSLQAPYHRSRKQHEIATTTDCSQALSQKQLQRSASRSDSVRRITKAGFKNKKRRRRRRRKAR